MLAVGGLIKISANQRASLKYHFENQFKVLLALGFLYIFFVSLGLLSDAFIVLGGAGLNEILEAADEILSNPFCGLILGILLTVLVQSSSTSTSIFITMTGSGLLKVWVIQTQILNVNCVRRLPKYSFFIKMTLV